jgi:toxin ParE1/3/4
VIVLWSPKAIRHLSDLRAHIERDNLEASARIALAILAAVDRVAEFPNLGRPGRVAGTHELVAPGTPYVIPYRLKRGRIEIIAVFHGRQRWPSRI